MKEFDDKRWDEDWILFWPGHFGPEGPFNDPVPSGDWLPIPMYPDGL